MRNSRSLFLKVLWFFLIVFIVIQFFRPEKNNGGSTTNDISKIFIVPERVELILRTACLDCHSNKTVYPWYANIQPVAWWLNDHTQDGKKSLNFNEFAAYRPRRQFHKLEEIDELVQLQEMPLKSYTWLHANARLDANQRAIIIRWTKDLRDSMKVRYPADSLVMPKRR